MRRPVSVRLFLAMLGIVAGAPVAEAHDPTGLPLGDGRLSSAPRTGYVFSCQQRFPANAPGARGSGPWIRGGSWDSTAKPTVQGRVDWPNARITVTLEGGERVIRGNSLPTHTTGTFPIARSDPAYRYDRNPNRIRARQVELRLPAVPVPAARASCVPMGPVGIALTGAHIYNALDARGRDAPAHEMQDRCGGHPQEQGQYHYHNNGGCFGDAAAGHGRHSDLIGYALDGFGIYGPLGDGGRELVNEDLDACHGHVGRVVWDGTAREIYHYHVTREYPYIIGCFTGTPASYGRPSGAQGGAGGLPSAGRGDPGRGGQLDRPPGPGRMGSRGGPPPGGDPLAAVADELGVDVGALRRAVGPPPPDIARASRLLGIDERALRDAFERHRPR